jgi:hypothetical protein
MIGRYQRDTAEWRLIFLSNIFCIKTKILVGGLGRDKPQGEVKKEMPSRRGDEKKIKNN